MPNQNEWSAELLAEQVAEQAMFERIAAKARANGQHTLADTYLRGAEMVARNIAAGPRAVVAQEGGQS